MRNRRRLARNLILYTLICMLIGFCIGFIVGRPMVVADATVETVVEPSVVELEIVPRKIPLGVCKLTAYCSENYPHICNDGDSTLTSTGVKPTVGRTVAVDPSVIPYGSEVIINGHTYIAEDCGGSIKGNRVDIFFATHQEALDFGIQYADVFYVEKSVSEVPKISTTYQVDGE